MCIIRLKLMQVLNAMEQLDKVLIVLLIYSVFKTDKKDFAKVFLNEWKYIFTEKNAKQYIYGDLEILSDESNKKYFDEEDYNEG